LPKPVGRLISGEGVLAKGISMVRRRYPGTLFAIAIVVGMMAGQLSLVDVASARERRQLDATPFAHSPCSVLDSGPCTPSFCSVFHSGPCIPEMNYPYGENLQVTVMSVPSQDDQPSYRKPDRDLNTIGDLFAALRSCWSPPPADSAHAGMQMAVKFAFNRAGAMIAAPRITFASHDVGANTRDIYLKAIDSSLDGCLPLKLTKGLGGAIAGRPIMIRYVDNRDLQKQSASP
jgi:hypothetical protein